MFLAALLYLIDALDGIDGFCPQLAVIFHGNISALLELKAGIDSELLAGKFAVNFRPLSLAGILLSVECFATLLAAESELLKQDFVEIVLLNLRASNKLKTYLAIVSDEEHSMSWINLAGAEVARLDSHVYVVSGACGT